MADRDKFVRPFSAHVWRASMGYTVAILRRVPGEADRETSLDVLDMSWSEAERLRVLLKDFLGSLPAERVGFGSVLKQAIKHDKARVATLERELSEAKKHLSGHEEKLRFVSRRQRKVPRG